MSYDLTFWRQTDDLAAEPPDVQRHLIEGHHVVGVEEFPSAAMREGVASEFADWVRVDHDSWEKEGQGEGPAFQLFTTSQVFHVTCYGLGPEDMNRLVEVALGFNCRLFDPQTGERFDQE